MCDPGIRILPVIPQFFILYIRPSCQTRSNAFDISKNTAPVICPESSAHLTSVSSLTRWSSMLLPFLKPDRVWPRIPFLSKYHLSLVSMVLHKASVMLMRLVCSFVVHLCFSPIWGEELPLLPSNLKESFLWHRISLKLSYMCFNM